MNDPAEIPTDLSSDELAERLEGALEGAGWKLGQNADTPHLAHLYYRPRTRSPSYDLAGMASADEHAVVEAVARGHGGRVALLTDLFVEWRGGRQAILLGRNGAGHYDGASWSSIRDGQRVVPDLPADFLDALRAEPPDADRMLTALTDHMYGEPTNLEASADVALVEAYHPFDSRWREVLEPLFLAVRLRLAAAPEGHELEVPGLAVFRRLDSERGVFEAVHRPHESLREFFADAGNRLSVDLADFLGQPADPGLARALADACARARDDQVDVLVGADLALHASVYAPYEGVDPRTGESILIPGRKLPVFIGW
jgi:hypothetical protein